MVSLMQPQVPLYMYILAYSKVSFHKVVIPLKLCTEDDAHYL